MISSTARGQRRCTSSGSAMTAPSVQDSASSGAAPAPPPTATFSSMTAITMATVTRSLTRISSGHAFRSTSSRYAAGSARGKPRSPREKFLQKS